MKKIVLILISIIFLATGLFIAYLIKQDGGTNDLKGQDILTYDVQDNKLDGDPTLVHVSGAQWKPFVEQKQMHREVWTRVTDIIPADLVKYVDTCIFSMGNASYVAFVHPTVRSWDEKWTINLDVKTMHDPLQFVSTIVHEFAHIVTLNKKQIDYDQDKEDCSDRFIEGYGCGVPTSYMNMFYDRFWKSTKKEWSSYKDKEKFFEKHPEQFVSAYAATDPSEDIAESFTSFVFSKNPTGNTVADKKIAFFYDFPELVKLRATLLARTNSYLSKNMAAS